MTAVTDLTILQENEGNDTATGDQQDISSSDIMFVIRIVISTIGEYNLYSLHKKPGSKRLLLIQF